MAGQDTIVLNEFVDRVLGMARDSIAHTGQSSVPLPDFNENFDTGGFLRITGKFKTTGGRFGDLSTLRRTGDVVMETGEEGLTVRAEMGLGTAYAKTDRYWLSLGRRGITVEGTVNVRVGRNSASAMILLTRVPGTGAYKTELVYARVDDLDDFHVTLTGLGIFSSLMGRVASWVARRVKNEIRAAMSEIVEDAIRAVLEDFDVNDTVRLLVNSQLCPPLDSSAVAYTFSALRSIYNTFFE